MDFTLTLRLPVDPVQRQHAVSTLLGAAAVLDQTGADADWQPDDLPQQGVVTVPGGQDVPCRITIADGCLLLTLPGYDVGANPRTRNWCEAVARRVASVTGPAPAWPSPSQTIL